MILNFCIHCQHSAAADLEKAV